MEDVRGRAALAEFVGRVGTIGIFSTSATVVEFDDELFNVSGSTKDPTIDGQTWKGLLRSNGIDDDCYVTNPGAKGSHPSFNVGGHMTTNASGEVEEGADTYLMPLCSWHNHTARDGVAFTHAETKMLRLTGFMQGELAASFMARMPSDEPFSLVYFADGEWKWAHLSEEQATDVGPKLLRALDRPSAGDSYVLFEQSHEGAPLHYVREAHLEA